MRHFRNTPEVNAGSMADIAFLLLIFFLVTTTIAKDKGIIRALPEPCPRGEKCDVDIYERNVFRIAVNENGELFVNDNPMHMRDLGVSLKNFIDNNGDGSCTYCFGKKSALASDNPQLAAIVINTSPLTSYKYYISIQDELTKAYYDLREEYVNNILKKDIANLTSEELKKVQQAYPFRISEANIK